MLNEKEEFLAYTSKPNYRKADKHTYLGRFNFDMLTKFIGLTRVLTLIARRYMFESGEANIDRARMALCAWCSVPDPKKGPTEKGRSKSNGFRLSARTIPGIGG